MTLVVKLGSSLVVDGRGRVRRAVLQARVGELAGLVNAGERVCVVSSGAIALGLHRLGLTRRPRSLPKLQAASALGQARLQAAWESAFASEGIAAAQVLLTAADVADRAAYVNARQALQALLAVRAVPVVNENDATATDEITFGDNDALAAQTAVLAGAKLLVLLTSVHGVLTHPPEDERAELIADGARARAATLGGTTGAGSGGMASKIAAAELAAGAGIPTVIAAGTDEGVLLAVAAGERRGTWFEPAASGESAFKLWLRYGKRIAGRVHLDAGAVAAVATGGRSLLAVGVTRCDGDFRAGDGIELCGPDGVPVGRGIASVDASELAGRPANLEAVHRDRLVLYGA